MAGEVNNLSNIFTTGVKFYASLTRDQALGIDPLTDNNGNPLLDEQNNYIYVEPGAICFVADEDGNSIILNNLLFGDGSGSGGGGGGSVTSVQGRTGRVVINLSDFPIVRENNTTLKTLDDYFQADGTLITNNFEVITNENNPSTLFAIYTENDVNKGRSPGVYIGGKLVATQEYATSAAGQAYNNAVNYANSLITNVYVVKGSVQRYEDLPSSQDQDESNRPKSGWVYNVETAHGTIPAGTNYVYVQEENSVGYWDALGGTVSVDLEGYITVAQFNEAISQLNSTMQSTVESLVNNSLSTINNNISSINQNLSSSGGVFDQLNNHNTRITNNTTNITNISQQLTWQ